MVIDKELSCEIATALLTGQKREPHELRVLKETVIRIHTTLQRLAESCEEIGVTGRRLDGGEGLV